MGNFGTLNGRKVYPSFCSNSRYYCTVYKDKILRPVFNIDNPWINIFLPVCQSRKCQRRAGSHPRAGSLPLIRGCAPPAPDAGRTWGEPPLSPYVLPCSRQPGTTSEVHGERCPQVITARQPPHLQAVASSHHASWPQPLPRSNWNMDDANTEEGAWGQTHGGAKGCSLTQVFMWLLSHRWDVVWHLGPLCSVSPASVCAQRYSKVNADMLLPSNPFETETWRNWHDASKHLRELCPPAIEAWWDWSVSLGPLDTLPIKKYCWWISKLILLRLFIKDTFFF